MKIIACTFFVFIILFLVWMLIQSINHLRKIINKEGEKKIRALNYLRDEIFRQ
jgi:uncharacterized membrane protein